MKDKKSKIKTAISVGLVIILANIGLQTSRSFNKKSDVENYVRNTNKQCPVELDEFARLDSVYLENPTKLINVYTMKIDLDNGSLDINAFNSSMKTNLLQQLAKLDQASIFKKEGIVLGYHYFTEKKQPISQIQINPEEY